MQIFACLLFEQLKIKKYPGTNKCRKYIHDQPGYLTIYVGTLSGLQLYMKWESTKCEGSEI